MWQDEPNPAPLVAERFAAADEARSLWLAEQIAKEPDPSRICKRGHTKRQKAGGKWDCPTCNAERMRAARARGI